ncbi:Major facilitator superfamily (MFS) [Carpediemonas membranifera]|uniref:Major facilitator superfamily (MFS) n=1 Tax=Carpediemonas membranifera TaxID=201153 RepID=A0A8J6B6B1_9EUKA|nr:Major facilitator superfamily (MFS) [Carpediemonas membranifera]|eukprot:KAG9395179.1 Major facilitator superfamily (MFS) [Carpediemonas membranifera]
MHSSSEIEEMNESSLRSSFSSKSVSESFLDDDLDLQISQNDSALHRRIFSFFTSPLGKNLMVVTMLMITIAGMEIEWAGVYSWASSTLLEHGASGELSTLPFQLSPIISVIIIPIAGWASDRVMPRAVRYRYGSRRLILTVSILLCGASSVCVPLTSGTIFPQLPNMFIVVSQLFLNTFIDILNKFIESFVRALVSTVADPRIEGISHVLTTGILGFAMIFGFQATSLPLNDLLPVGHTMNLYFPLGVLIFFITAIPVFFSRAEARACCLKDNVDTPATRDRPLLSVADDGLSRVGDIEDDGAKPDRGARKRTSWVRVGLVLLWGMLSFFSAWTPWVFNPEFLGVEIYHGDPHAAPDSPAFHRYEKGSRLAGSSDSLISVGVLLSVFIWIALDALLAKPLGRFRPMVFGAAFNVVMVVGMGLCAFSTSLPLFVFSQLLMGMGFGGSTNFIFSRAAHYTHISDVGLVNTLVFSAETLPQMLMTVSGTMAVGLTGSYRAPYVLGAVPMLIAIPLTFFL